MRNLAEVYRLQERYAEAEPLFRKATEGQLRALGADHRRTLEALEGLVATLIELQRFQEARALGEKLLKHYERLFGPANARTQTAVGLLVDLNDRSGESEMADHYRTLLSEMAVE
jgi:tetratricopeptide (TPR) repeat protein